MTTTTTTTRRIEADAVRALIHRERSYCACHLEDTLCGVHHLHATTRHDLRHQAYLMAALYAQDWSWIDCHSLPHGGSVDDLPQDVWDDAAAFAARRLP